MLKKKYKLIELVNQLTPNDLTQDIKIEGDPNCIIDCVSTIQASIPQSITFLNNSIYKKYLPAIKASAVILSPENVAFCPVTALITKDVYYIYSQIAAFFDDKPLVNTRIIHSSVVIGENCDIDSSASIGAQVVIGNRVKIANDVIIGAGCVIGDDVVIAEASIIDPRVTLYYGTHVGKRVTIASGCVIGSDGFGIAKHQGKWYKVPQLGRVRIEDHVEIGANCTIDRGAIEDTVIEEGVKLDNLIQIGHNVRVGAYSALAGCVGVSGSTTIGKHCLIGGGSGFAGHLQIADGVMITGMTAVTKSITTPGIYSSGVGGLVPNTEWRKHSARLHRLGDLTDRVKRLEAKIAKLTERNIT